MGLFWLVMGHVFHMISYVDCDVDCDMDSYMPGGGGMLTTDIEASRWSNIYKVNICQSREDCRLVRLVPLLIGQDREMILAHIMDVDSFNLQLQLAIFGTEGSLRPI